ncbi:apolipoprotein N-acyltransferase [Pendulispora albinea]|uniref:Apolipoprotein N-acyltransferase n=1 Tax=Pendulispora albinea TaxID=2741071 RepID=A0ABZ2LXQ4_9BACT
MLSGALFASTSPPFDFVIAPWLGMALLACALDREPPSPSAGGGRWRVIFRGGARGLAFGFAANAVALRFVPGVITRFTPLPWAVGALALALLAMAQGLRWAAAAWVHRALVRWRVPRPLAFAVGVYAGTFVPAIFPWNPAGGATLWPELLQLADTIGERGVSALMALTSALAAFAVQALRDARKGKGGDSASSKRPALAMALGAAFLALGSYVHGRLRMAEVDALRAHATTAKVALVQPSVGATERWDRQRARQILATLTELTRTAERDGAELTVWHESAYPYELRHGATHAPETPWTLLQPGVHGPILAGVVLHGTPLVEGGPDRYNSALVVDRNGALSAPYDKIHLLWFGETVPLADVFPWIRRTFARGLGLVQGSTQVVLDSGKVRASVLICFEDTLPAAGREALSLSPNLLVNVTNDAWFTAEGSADAPPRPPSEPRSSSDSRHRDGLEGADEASLESELHLRMAILRSIEGRRDMVRAVNFGPTTWVDAAGRVRARYASTSPGTLLTTPALLETPPTLYVRYGDMPFAVFALLATLAATLVLESGATKRQRRQLQAKPDADAYTASKPE